MLRRPAGRERVAVVAVLAVAALALVLPLAVLVRRSLGSWDALFRETPALLVEPWQAAVYSIAFASVAAAIALIVGGLAAVALARRPPGVVDGLVLLPLGASAVMLGFGFLIAFDTAPLDFRSSWWLVPVAQSLVAAPFVVRIVAPALRSIDPRLREVAATLGASPGACLAGGGRSARRPRLRRRRGFAFAIALGEFGATVFVARAEQPTLPVAIFRFLGRPGAENQGLAAALAVVLAAYRRLCSARGRAVRRRARAGALMLRVDDARVVLGGHEALAGVDLEVEDGSIVAVLGPSGSGKSTLLRAIAGLQRLDEGSVTLDGRSLAGVPPHRRGIGLMFQDDALFPHRDVAANVAFGLRMQGTTRAAVAARVTELLDLVGLGGAGIARSARSPAASASASPLRGRWPRRRACFCSTSRSGRSTVPSTTGSSIELRELFDEIGQTALYVTHDVAEAFAIGTRVAVMRDGAIVQLATPERLWASPADAWVARFIGLANVEDAARGRS